MADTRRRLVISPVPGRQGQWLVVMKGTSFHPVAKFRDDEALAEFVAWIKDGIGFPLRYEDETGE